MATLTAEPIEAISAVGLPEVEVTSVVDSLAEVCEEDLTWVETRNLTSTMRNEELGRECIEASHRGT